MQVPWKNHELDQSKIGTSDLGRDQGKTPQLQQKLEEQARNRKSTEEGYLNTEGFGKWRMISLAKQSIRRMMVYKYIPYQLTVISKIINGFEFFKFHNGSLLFLFMRAIPLKKKDFIVQVQKQENNSWGCCFTTFRFSNNNNYQAPQRYRPFSEPKASKTQKIEITIAKRRHSQSKTDNERQRTESRQRLQPFSTEPKKEHQISKVALTIGSKISTQRNSLKASKVSFNRELQFQYRPRQIKPPLVIANTAKLQQQQKMTAHNDFTSLPFISEISLVEQQFVSQGSESLQALNFIAQMPSASKKLIPSSTLALQLSRISEEKQSRSSMSRMMEYKKEINGSGRKRLAL